MSASKLQGGETTPKGPMKAKLVILGATGDGKSSLGNFILNKKDLFTVRYFIKKILFEKKY